MTVRDKMSTNVNTLTDDKTLGEAAALIKRTGRRHVPILSAIDNKLVGIISDRDVARFAPSTLFDASAEARRDFEQTPLTMVMTANPITIGPDESIATAAHTMHANKIGALLVAEKWDLLGIVTNSDMLGILIEMLEPSQGLDDKAFE